MTFKLAPNLTLPASAVTDTFAYMGTRGSGKTYAAGKMVEEFCDGGFQVVVVDPVGVWYGLRLSSNGRGRGLDVPVFGGDHADVPLEPTAGELVARLVVEGRTSLVLDVSLMTLGQQHRFVTAFATTLFNLKKSNRSPVHLVLEEAHEFLPQVVQANEAEMVGAVRRLWKIGRNFGIGGTLVSQRPAEVNKSALNLTERMFCGKLKGALDRKAMEGWAREQGAETAVLDELPRLKSGDLVYWTEQGTTPVRFLGKRTYDASKTPEAGDVRPTSALPPIDLDAVRKAMAASVEEAKANDPKLLRVRIAELERRPPNLITPTERVEIVPAGLMSLPNELADLVVQARGLVIGVESVADQAEKMKDRIQGAIIAYGKRATLSVTATSRPGKLDHQSFVNGSPVAEDRSARTAIELAKCPAALLRVLNQRGTATGSQVAALAGYSVNSTTFSNGLSTLRVAGLIVGRSGRLEITEAGRRVAGPPQELPTGARLLDYWVGSLDKCPGSLLKALYDAGGVLERAQLAEDSGYSLTSTTFGNGLSALRVRELVTAERGAPVEIAEVFRTPSHS